MQKNATTTSMAQAAWPTTTESIPQSAEDKAQNQQRYTVNLTTDQGSVAMPVTRSLSDPEHTMSIEQTAHSLSLLPTSALHATKEIFVKPDPGFSAYANDQTFTFLGVPDSQVGANRVAAHETGHNVQGALAKHGDSLPGGNIDAQWAAAQKSDNNAPSAYARTSPAEDFGEAQRLYLETLARRMRRLHARSILHALRCSTASTRQTVTLRATRQSSRGLSCGGNPTARGAHVP